MFSVNSNYFISLVDNIEVDGKQHEDVVQKKRDERKDRILQEAGLKLIRIKTTDVDVQNRIEQQLRRG